MKDLHLNDDYMEALAEEIERDANPSPTVVLTGTADDGRQIRVYEAVALGPTDDDPIQRGLFWLAVDTEVKTYPSRRDSNGQVIPGRIIGDHLVISIRSAQDALDRARAKLAA